MAIAVALAASSVAGAQPAIFVPQPPPLAPPPPPIRVTGSPVRDAEAQNARVIEVRVAAGSRTLLNDRFRVSNRQGASFSTTRNEANAVICDSYGWGSGDSTALNVRISAAGGVVVKQLRVSLTWSRPSAQNQGCERSGSQSVGIEQTVEVLPGRTTVIRGDADTVIELRDVTP